MAVLRFIQTHQYGNGLSAKERDRIYKRAKAYRWMGSSVFKQLPGDRMVVVPKEAERESIALETHRGMGHYGVQRVLDRLQQNYWWRGMGDTVVRIFRACLSCARVKAGFKESGKELQPLPIRGMGYRWRVDFAGPLATTPWGNKWILVCIEHFSKWVELIPLPSKSSANAARGVLEGVLSWYRAPEEVLTKVESSWGNSMLCCPNMRSHTGWHHANTHRLTGWWSAGCRQ